jgi:hypothetical protein
VKLYNPLLKEFRYPWKNDQNEQIELVMKAAGFTEFPEYQAVFMKKHLADEIFNTQGYPKKNSVDDYKEIYKVIEGDV